MSFEIPNVAHLAEGHARVYNRADCPTGRWSRASADALYQALEGAISGELHVPTIEQALKQLQPAKDAEEPIFVHIHAGSTRDLPVITLNDRCLIDGRQQLS